ncbi:putative glycolipid-binding domain-containing protein [Micromonosporaceae bacterium DT55]|uniref:putative glycolipid-binding domain-containing protein n=1 Tax=Melissospora conviva TaxID=3388432 RepID=UPI003C19F488
MAHRLLSWAGIGDPQRIENASIELHGESMRAIGGACAEAFTTNWELEVADGWQTRALHVTVRGFGWSRSLDLTRAPTGDWCAAVARHGEIDLPEPGLDDPGTVAGAIDCDLALCPVTNTMPIRRLRLLDRDVADTHLVMAWVEIPSLRVLRSDQVYASAAPEGKRRVKYTSFSRNVSTHLTVDADGLVIDYPELARRLRPEPAH